MKKEFSKCCKRCGVEWDETMSNKYQKRALCKDCAKNEYSIYQKKYRVDVVYKVTLGQPYKFNNRLSHWNTIREQTKEVPFNLTEIRKYTQKRFEEIINDKELMEYINYNEK